MNKKELREKYRLKRQEFNQFQIEEMSLAIANNVLKLAIWDAIYFHIFLPIEINNEVNTAFILYILQGKDKEIVISKSDFETLEMTHYLMTDNTKIKNNKYNIPEPIDGIEVPVSKIDVVFVPLLAYDKTGNRIGYGKVEHKLKAPHSGHIINVNDSPIVYVGDAIYHISNLT